MLIRQKHLVDELCILPDGKPRRPNIIIITMWACQMPNITLAHISRWTLNIYSGWSFLKSVKLGGRVKIQTIRSVTMTNIFAKEGESYLIILSDQDVVTADCDYSAAQILDYTFQKRAEEHSHHGSVWYRFVVAKFDRTSPLLLTNNHTITISL